MMLTTAEYQTNCPICDQELIDVRGDKTIGYGLKCPNGCFRYTQISGLKEIILSTNGLYKTIKWSPHGVRHFGRVSQIEVSFMEMEGL